MRIKIITIMTFLEELLILGFMQTVAASVVPNFYEITNLRRADMATEQGKLLKM